MRGGLTHPITQHPDVKDHPCVCEEHSITHADGRDIYGCGSKANFIFRHNAVLRQLKLMCDAGGVAARLEPHIDWPGGKRPDLEVYLDAESNRGTLVDVVVSHPGCTTYIARAAGVGGGGRVALDKEVIKRAKYEAASRALGYEFQPFSVETYGHFGPAAVALIDRVCTVASQLRDKDYGSFKFYWMGRLAVALQEHTGKGFLRIAYDVKTRALRRGHAARADAFVDDDEEEDVQLHPEAAA